MKNLKPILYLSPLSTAHDTGDGHPECAERVKVLEELFKTAPFKNWPQKKSKPAALDQILSAHTEDYIFDLQDKTPDYGLTYYDGDTVLSPATYDAALHAAGAASMAVDDVLSGNTTRAFCAIRPPGHHAEPHSAMGFCFFNNAFIAARQAQIFHGIKKVAIVDFDIHHGNGTETMTRAHNTQNPDAPIFYISTHGHPLFPMSGDPADNNDTLLNIRLPENCASAEFRAVYNNQVFPALNAFAPELLILKHLGDIMRLIRLNGRPRSRARRQGGSHLLTQILRGFWHIYLQYRRAGG